VCVALCFAIMAAGLILMLRTFAAEYILSQNVDSDKQEKMLALTGKQADGGSSSHGSDTADDADGVERRNDAYENEGNFTGMFGQLRSGLETLRKGTVGGIGGAGDDTKPANAETSSAASGRSGRAERRDSGLGVAAVDAQNMVLDEKDQAEQDLKQLAASTVDVLRQMFHHVSRTGGDEEKLMAAMRGAGEWRDRKSDADFLDDENNVPDGEEPMSYLRRYGVVFEQFNKRNRLHGFLEVFATLFVCASTGFWFFSSSRLNCAVQGVSFLSVSVLMTMLMYVRKPFIANFNYAYSLLMLVFHTVASLGFTLGFVMQFRQCIIMGYIVGVCCVYLCAFRSLLDIYLVLVTRIGGEREPWPAIQELTDLFLAAKDRRDKGQMMTGPEITNERASARSGRSARSAASRRSARFTQQFGKNGIQLFFKLAIDSDKFRGSRAIPEEYHPFIMRPLPPLIELITEQRRTVLREKIEKVTAKAKWEAQLSKLTAEENLMNPTAQVNATQAMTEGFEDAADEERKRLLAERKARADEQRSVPKLMRDLFTLGLQTKFDEADRSDLEASKVSDLLFPVDAARAKKLDEQQRQLAHTRSLARRLATTGPGRDGKKDLDDAFASWMRVDKAAIAARIAKNEADDRAVADAMAAGVMPVGDSSASTGGSFRRGRSTSMRASFLSKAKAEKKTHSSSATEKGDSGEAAQSVAAALASAARPSAAPADLDDDIL
jgi:hypothetical protein